MNDNEALVREVINDFKERQQERRKLETTWQLNINFLLGNQYSAISTRNEIVNYDKQYFWQEREVFNHIASIYELRLSKLNRVKPQLTVLPFSDEEDDIVCAKVSKNILNATIDEQNLKEKISQATMWSEICGTGFYKVVWDTNGGRLVGNDSNGQPIYEGNINVDVVSPFEIFPDSNSNFKIGDCKSIIHARAYHQSEVKTIWGVDVEGTDLDVFTLDSLNNIGGFGYNGYSSSTGVTTRHNNVLVIERYISPTTELPNGRLTIVAGNKLLFDGDLPYINQAKSKRGFPFIKQCAIIVPGSFWGVSVIERCIPVQRAYNAIRNRKHEFINRLSMGVLTVEDGSVDTDDLEEEGMSPGKVLIYRQGSTPPKQMTPAQMPTGFDEEEDRLLNEFMVISGVTDLVRNNSYSTNNISGVALQLLIEQDESRLTNAAEQIRNAIKEVAEHILRLYKQFATFPHTSRLIGEKNSVEIFYWKNTNISSDEVVFESESEISETIAQKRSMIFQLLDSGLLSDENGKMDNATKFRVLDSLGYGVWNNTLDMEGLHLKRASKENLNLRQKKQIMDPKTIDNHKIHIDQHIAYMLSDEFNTLIERYPHLEQMMLDHISKHKQMLKEETNA